MSGLAAIFNRDCRAVDERMLAAMLDAIVHRGPDGAGSWIEGGIGLGQRMLNATPESAVERQPLRDETGRFSMVFDGRIDNGPELRGHLAAAGLECRSS